jgi:general secretion pathway protein D
MSLEMPQKHQPRTRKPALSNIAGTLLMVLLAGCATPESARLEVPSSALQSDSTFAEGRQVSGRDVSGQGSDALQRSQPAVAMRAEKPLFSQIDSMATAEMRAPSNQNVDLAAFSPDQQVQLRSDQLPLEEFLHEVFGKLLQVSYTIDQTLERRLSETVTLNLQESVSQRELFRLTTRLLASKQIDVIGRDGVYFITLQQDRGGRDLRIGIGSRPSDVPDSDSDVLQIVSVKYGTPGGFQVVLKQLFAVNINVQEEKQFMFIQGAAPNVRRALELLRLLDAPASRAREVGLIDLVYLEPDEFLADLEQLLDAEGVSLGRGRNKGPLAIVPLTRRQAVVVFSSNRDLLQRVYHWARQLDVPGETTEKEYFLYEPQNARAVDMGESLERLISLSEGGSSGSFGGSRRATETNSATSGSVEVGSESESGASASGGSVRGENLSMVVNERQNQLMFYATPAEYDKVRPLLLRLDQSPPQVALEVIIAEVTLTDELQFGVEWFLEKNNYSLGTLGALGIGSSGLNITAIDADLGLDVIANLSKTENLVNVLSRPRIVVSDGSSATVNVGTDIPILTSTASDVSSGEFGSGTTIVQTVQYRSTGVVLNVTPTVNGQGMVAMELSQEISNTSSDAIPGINSPVISQRSFQTSLMVGNGQTAVVGGLISDNNTQGATAVPWLSDIPWLGRLFRSETRGRDKTEILVMITPRIINGASDMQGLTERLMDGMEGLTLGRDIEEPIDPD